MVIKVKGESRIHACIHSMEQPANVRDSTADCEEALTWLTRRRTAVLECRPMCRKFLSFLLADERVRKVGDLTPLLDERSADFTARPAPDVTC